MFYDDAVELIRESHDEGFRAKIRFELDKTARYSWESRMIRFTELEQFPCTESDYLKLYLSYDRVLVNMLEDFINSNPMLTLVRQSISAREVAIRTAKLAVMSVLYNDHSDLEKYGHLT